MSFYRQHTEPDAAAQSGASAAAVAFPAGTLPWLSPPPPDFSCPRPDSTEPGARLQREVTA